MNEIDTNSYGLSKSDLEIFETACRQAIFYGNSILYVSDILPKLHEMSFPDNDINLSLKKLCKFKYLNKKLSLINRNKAEYIFLFSIEHTAFKKYLLKNHRNYYSMLNKIYSYLFIDKPENTKSEQISEKLNIPKMLVNHFLEELHLLGLIKLTKRIRGNWFVEEVYGIEKNSSVKREYQISSYL
jgi:predicted transcriptional regulator